MDAKEATEIVREYFDSIKKIKFIFDVRNVKFDDSDYIWVITCDVQNVFEENPISYEVGVDPDTGDIEYVEEIE